MPQKKTEKNNKTFGSLPNCLTFVGHNGSEMKTQLRELIKKIVFEILTDLLDDGKLNQSNGQNANKNLPT